MSTYKAAQKALEKRIEEARELVALGDALKTLAGLDQAVTDLTRTRDTLRTENTDLETEAKRLRGQRQVLAAEVAAKDGAAKAAEGRIATATQAADAAHAGRMAALDTEYAAKRAEHERHLLARIADLEGKAEAAEARLAKAESGLAAVAKTLGR